MRPEVRTCPRISFLQYRDKTGPGNEYHESPRLDIFIRRQAALYFHTLFHDVIIKRRREAWIGTLSLKNEALIFQIDPHAFVIVENTLSVLGKVFSSLKRYT